MKRLHPITVATALLLGVGCGPKEAPMQRTYLYAPVDTTWQKPFACTAVNPYDIFPNAKFCPRVDLIDAEVHDGMATLVLEINRPMRLAVLPVRDSTKKFVMGEARIIYPGDSLEVRTVRNSAITRLEAYTSDLVGGAYRHNTCERLLRERFPYAEQPHFDPAEGLAGYKARIDAFTAERLALLDSCSCVMPLSDHYLRHMRQSFALERYAALASELRRHPELEAPEGYFDDAELPEDADRWSIYYAQAMQEKYIYRDFGFETERHYAEIGQRIARAPRKLRDYLTVLQIGHFAAKQQQEYQAELAATIERAERTIRDTVYRSYIALAKKFYDNRSLELPDSVLQQTLLRTPDDEKPLTLGEVLQRYEGRPLYIDFWASWCSGCIMDMQDSAEAKAYLAEQGVTYLYLSIDKSAEAWQRASERLGVAQDSYLCFGELNSPLAHLLQLQRIPHYLLLDRQHRIIRTHAPRPIPHFLPELKRAVETMRQP